MGGKSRDAMVSQSGSGATILHHMHYAGAVSIGTIAVSPHVSFYNFLTPSLTSPRSSPLSPVPLAWQLRRLNRCRLHCLVFPV